MNEQLIQDYESGMSYDALCKKYHHKFATIKQILKQNGIDTAARDRKKYLTNKYLSADVLKNLINDYLKGYSLNKISTLYNLSVQKTRSILKENNIVLRQVSNKKYYLNEDYFDELSSNGAYIIGFFAADGWIKKKDNMAELTLSKNDAQILEDIHKELEMSRPIRYFQDNAGFEKASLTFSSQKIKKIFEQYGVVPNKTFTMKHLPNLPKELMVHYIRGYADGDGYVSEKTWSICSVNKTFLEEIIEFLNVNYNVDKVNIYEDNRTMIPLYSFQYCKQDSLNKIFNALYKNKGLKLKRKFIRFCNEINYHETLLHQ